MARRQTSVLAISLWSISYSTTTVYHWAVMMQGTTMLCGASEAWHHIFGAVVLQCNDFHVGSRHLDRLIDNTLTEYTVSGKSFLGSGEG